MERTKQLRIGYWLCALFSFLLTWGPIILYTVLAYQSKTATTADKFVLTSLLTIGTILSLVCLVNKYTLRCKHWLILIGLWLCLDKFLGTILVIAITQIVDELLVCPMKKYYGHKLSINKEIDKRS